MSGGTQPHPLTPCATVLVHALCSYRNSLWIWTRVPLLGGALGGWWEDTLRKCAAGRTRRCSVMCSKEKCVGAMRARTFIFPTDPLPAHAYPHPRWLAACSLNALVMDDTDQSFGDGEGSLDPKAGVRDRNRSISPGTGDLASWSRVPDRVSSCSVWTCLGPCQVEDHWLPFQSRVQTSASRCRGQKKSELSLRHKKKLHASNLEMSVT